MGPNERPLPPPPPRDPQKKGESDKEYEKRQEDHSEWLNRELYGNPKED